MNGRKWTRRTAITCALIALLLDAARGEAELKPGDTLDQTRWQEAKGMMPDAILRRLETGQHVSRIIELPPAAVQWGRHHKELTEANLGKYDVDQRGVLIEKSTGSWPRYYPGGFPFAQIDANDPKAAYKIIYNFYNRGGPIDDIDLFLNMFWVEAEGLSRSIDFVGQVLSYASRWSGPFPNPEEVAAETLVYGVAPSDVVGLATLRWAYLDPDKWSSLWAYIPTIRRVRRLAASNSSDGVFGSYWSFDDGALFSGKVQYFPWPGKSKLFDQNGQSWSGAA